MRFFVHSLIYLFGMNMELKTAPFLEKWRQWWASQYTSLRKIVSTIPAIHSCKRRGRHSDSKSTVTSFPSPIRAGSGNTMVFSPRYDEFAQNWLETGLMHSISGVRMECETVDMWSRFGSWQKRLLVYKVQMKAMSVRLSIFSFAFRCTWNRLAG